LKITKYQASQGNEYFLEFVNKDNILFGLLRLRIFKESIIIPLTPPNFPLFRSDLMTSKLTSSNFSDKKIVSPVKNFRNNINDISTKNKVNDTKNEMINNKRGYQYQPQAIIREVHVYGKSLELHKREGQANETVGVVAQHLGLGKELMKKAEEIAKKEKCKKIKIISGIGVRKYYKNLGYDLENTYMVKYL
jgi:histone acetyltransferase (RNA polymerase elongator complex component)